MFAVSGEHRTKPWLRSGAAAGAFGLGLVLALACIGGISSAQAQEAQPQAVEPDEDSSEAPALRRRLVDATSQEEEWAPDLSVSPAEEAREQVQRGDQALAAGRAEEGAGGALGFYARALALSPNSDTARSGVDRAIAVLVQRGEAAVAGGRFDEAARLSAMANRYRPQSAGVAALAAKISAGREQAQQLSAAQRHIDEGRLVAPAGNNAAEAYRTLLEADPQSEAALAGLGQVETLLIGQAIAAADEGDHAEADRLLAQAAELVPGSTRAQDAGAQIVGLREQQASRMEAELIAAIDAGEYDAAERLIGQLDAISMDGRGIGDLRTRLDNARNYASFSPGDILTDPVASGGEGPELVVIPLGTFMMGSPSGETGRVGNEGPQFQVRLSRGFAMSQTEVTVGQYRQFVNATGYVTTAQQTGRSAVYDESTGGLGEKPGVTWQDDHLGNRAAADLPVIHVSWNDAKAYVDWLARETGQRYRLPTEAEFEYALRAGGDTAFPWGNDRNPGQVLGNLTGDGDRSESRRTWSNAFENYSDGHWGPAPVRTFAANPFGLHNMIGNTSEWVEDCWHDSYQRAPADGSAWVNPGCTQRVIRGASWASAPGQVRSAFRLSAAQTSTNPRLGFRVVREF